MKKTYKFIALLMSAFLLSQISAAAAPYASYPFVYEDFEDGTIGGFYKRDKNMTDDQLQFSSDGYGNSAGALKVDFKKDYDSGRVKLLNMEKGKTYKLSFSLKASENLDATSIALFMYFPQVMPDGSAGKDPNVGYASVSLDKITIRKDEWIRFEKEYKFMGTANKVGMGVIDVYGNDGEVELRFGSGKLQDINQGEAFSYLLDDFCIEPVLTQSTVEDVEPNDKGGLIRDGSFEGVKHGKYWIEDGVTTSITQGGANETTQCLKVSGDGVFKQQIPLTYSHTYSFKGYIKGTSESAGKTAELVIDRGGKTEKYGIGTLSEDWQSFSFDYYNPSLDGDLTDPYMYVSVEDSADYYLDEISLSSEKSVIHNGDFSEDFGDYWTSENATVDVTDDIPAEDFTKEKSVHITQTVRNGSLYQYIYLQPDTEYKLSFWAKSSSANGKVIKQMLADSSGNTYEIPLPDGNKNFKADWTYYETTYKTESGFGGLFKYYIVVGGVIKAMDFYLADINFAENKADDGGEDDGESSEVKYTTPEIRNPFVRGEITENKTVTANAEYLGPAPQSGLIQLFKQAEDGGWASIKTAEFNGEPLEYTFKAADVGQKIKYRIIPIDETGYAGGIREAELEEAVHPELEITKGFNGDLGGTVSGFAEIINRGDKDENVVCMIMLYDDENSCVGAEYQAKTIWSHASETFDIEVSNPGSAVKAKLFVWEGTDDINTSMISLSKAIEIKK